MQLAGKGTNAMASPKIAVIGAGSHFFGRPVIYNMTHSPILRNGTLALVDTNEKVLGTMMGMARQAIDATGSPTKLIGSTDRREVLEGADFVVLTFSDRNAHFRGVDCEIAARHGVRMCSGDTIGPGGVFRALREIPTALDVARDTAELAPNAWVINFINPTTVLGIALMRFATSVRSFALCDGLHEPGVRLKMLKAVGILPEEATCVPPQVEQRLDLAIGGVNHFTWVTRFVYDSQDMLPKYRARQAEAAAKEKDEGHAKARFNVTYGLQLMDVYGAWPICMGHTKEYVPFWQGYGASSCEPAALTVFDAKERAEQMRQRMAENEDYAAGRKPIQEFLAAGKGDHATDIIEAMWGNLPKAFYINTANRGAFSNMAADAFLELRCDVDMSGPRPQPLGEMPRGVLGLTQQVLDTHELTAEAGATFSRNLVMRALATDPIVNNLVDAKKIMDETFDRQRDVLDKRWY
jgi:alpha-galactosidase